MTTNKCRWMSLLITIVALFHPPSVYAVNNQGLLFFLSVGPSYNVSSPEEGLEDRKNLADADILYSYLNGDFHFLAEYILSTEESELERFQLGYQFGKQTTSWLGRFHSSSRYWNFAYHHGKYLQTSISRPLIEMFEDRGGILPTHISGAMLESAFEQDNQAEIQLSVSFGKTSTIDQAQLKPFDLLDPDSNHNAAIDLRLAYLPDQLQDNQFGLTLSYSDLAVGSSTIATSLNLKNVKQITTGLYLDWQLQQWRFVSTLVRIENQMEKQGMDSEDIFISGYLQAEFEFNPEWTVFGRLEDTTDKHNSEYLLLFPNSIIERRMIGIRFDVVKGHALSMEVSRAETASEEFDQLLLQWSAVFP